MFSPKQTPRAVINIGGIANFTYIPSDGEVIGFDCGPGNGLMDLWVQRHQGKPYDRDGDWASQGKCHEALLALLMDEAYLKWAPPKSTGRELFNDKWLDQKLNQISEVSTVDVQTTLLEFTARTIQAHLQNLPDSVEDVFLCGGGAHNTRLVHRVQEL